MGEPLRCGSVAPLTFRRLRAEVKGDLLWECQVEAVGGGLQSEINVTPMVDIMLVLLIIFMVVTPFLAAGHHGCAAEEHEQPGRRSEHYQGVVDRDLYSERR